MRAIGSKESIMDKECFQDQTERNTQAILRMVNITGLVSSFGQKEAFIEENGRIVENMEMVNLLEAAALFMRVNGKMVDITGKED
jgi:cell fate (sporulation/competence/biofilm development) regulator YmcA (YheA/YmcA/DUF963 family)